MAGVKSQRDAFLHAVDDEVAEVPDLARADLLVEPVLQNVVVDVLVEVADVQLADDPGVPLVMAQPFLDVPFAVVRAAPPGWSPARSRPYRT